MSETGSTADPLGAHDYYDFSLQFSCYVLADKLQAPGFKRLILDEIRSYAEICNPADMTVDHVRYVYENTIRDDDPLRRFCIMIKSVRTPIEKTLADESFLSLMEDGGPLVRDVMQAYRKPIKKQNWIVRELQEALRKRLDAEYKEGKLGFTEHEKLKQLNKLAERL
ncbi:hypothetical protein ASPWEDRAFT_530538 [Aspergillus wentii DTO 134E9]|uniref:Uncharacterized protein n=1 Tax=Aspergillus wentii DTO 134E9 TaxID=1073089 RepID=A0A1L9RLR7_ASPWE|nr:uncharacterized protein ASPWEDRAFT_530538 [Aspergillus wentii DTO 134E9]KAI9929765.1 hypothetical protein MW887_001241 [Aspergillus wentii]OJJ35777.1 hypothetical protein ASPWEDRAFT_530538 [Aspergillus wentii DTO 134E9]